MKNDSEFFELENRYCPICGRFVRVGTKPHRCLDEDIAKIEEEEEKLESLKEVDEDLSYDDSLNEFDKFYNSDNYYDNDIEGE